MTKKDDKKQESLVEESQDVKLMEDETAEDKMVLQLAQDLTEANQKIEELTNVSKRALADLQNFKRRSEEDQRNLVAFANGNLVLEILPILDNFERAIEHKPEGAPQEWLDGILQIYNQFQKILEKQGVEVIKAEGEKYDPNFHEAMLHSSGKNGIIIQELEKGYLLKGKVIRPTKVSVGNGT